MAGLIASIFYFLLLVSRKEELPPTITGDFILRRFKWYMARNNRNVSFSIIFSG